MRCLRRASGVKRSEQGILSREIDAALGRLAAGPHLDRDRKLFWLYYRLGLTTDAMRLQSIGLSTKGEETSFLRLTPLFGDETGRDRLRRAIMLGLNEFIPQSRCTKKRRV